jgi:phosphotransferase system  glucose/maltose/N-acetylglucosamine-specific IIC component
LQSGLEILVKVGAITSTAGVAMLVAFVGVLLAFPVIKECEGENCTFESTAPEQLRSIINPGFLAASLLIIAAGIVMMRYSRWKESKAVS